MRVASVVIAVILLTLCSCGSRAIEGDWSWGPDAHNFRNGIMTNKKTGETRGYQITGIYPQYIELQNLDIPMELKIEKNKMTWFLGGKTSLRVEFTRP